MPFTRSGIDKGSRAGKEIDFGIFGQGSKSRKRERVTGNDGSQGGSHNFSRIKSDQSHVVKSKHAAKVGWASIGRKRRGERKGI